MTEKTGFQKHIKYSQSLTTGTFGFEGSISWDDEKDFEKLKNDLVNDLEKIETLFESKGYKIATITPTNAEKSVMIESGKQAKRSKEELDKALKA